MVKKIKLADLVEKYFVEHELFLSPAYREQIDKKESIQQDGSSIIDLWTR